MKVAQSSFSASDVKNYIEGNVRYQTKRYLPPHIIEQINFRSYLCSKCLLNGKCIKCGCTTPHMFYAPNKKDPNWGALIYDQKQWDKTKTEHPEFLLFTEISAEYNLSTTDADYPIKFKTKLLKQRDTKSTEDNPSIQTPDTGSKDV